MRIADKNCSLPFRRRIQDRRAVNVSTIALFVCSVAVLLFWQPSRSCAQAAQHLLIYAIDVEGGQATLLVSPSGGSLLVDTGWPNVNGRDAERIQAAMRD